MRPIYGEDAAEDLRPADATEVFEELNAGDDGGEIEAWLAEHGGRREAYSDRF